uniref:Uncharacterized protein n=1 Tax=Nymphaea colorata TaxID=210225 RepID=A0A5K1F4N1_9MAGN|nr:unnamed protein product [Nymphaea colorata]
MGSQCALE